MHKAMTAKTISTETKLKMLLAFWLIMLFQLTTRADTEKIDSDKVDLQKLEEKYWTAKDSTYSVVQNRLYTKSHRWFASVGYGPLINDGYSTGKILNYKVGYFLSELWGFELSYEKASLSNNATTDYFIASYGVSPDFIRYDNSTFLRATYVPFYAKMSFLDQSILYFDMSASLGIGKINYHNVTDTGDVAQSTTGTSLMITQHLFFSDHYSLRLDIENKFYSANLQKYHIPATADPATRSLGSQSTQDTSISVGLTFFY